MATPTLKIKQDADITEAIKILYYLRQHERKWHNEFGFNNRRNKDHWKKEADKWIEENILKKD